MRNLPFFLAFRYLRSKRKSKFLSVTILFSLIGIAIGVATLIIVTSVMSGFEYELIDKITGFNGHISIKANNGISYYYKFDNLLSSNANVDHREYVLIRNAISSVNDHYDGVVCVSFMKNPFDRLKIVSGSSDDDNSIGIGSIFAKSNGVRVGDKISIISSSKVNTPFYTGPRSKTFKVGYIFQVGIYQYDSSVIVLPMKISQVLFGLKNKITDIQIFLKNPKQVNDIGKKLSYILGRGEYLVDWMHSNDSLISAVRVEKNVMFLILVLIILIAGFNIVTSMVMLVKDKVKDIAILRTIGFSKKFILKIFMYTGVSIGFCGTAIGSVLGVLFSCNINYIKQILEKMLGFDLFNPEIYFLLDLPFRLEINSVILIIVISLLISFLSSVYPALKASKVNPVDILRYE